MQAYHEVLLCCFSTGFPGSAVCIIAGHKLQLAWCWKQEPGLGVLLL